MLAPNGRVEVLARVLCTADDRFELDTEVGYGDVLATRLNRFRIRVKAELEQSTIDLFAPLSTIGEPSVQESARSAHQCRVGWWDTGSWVDTLPSGAASAGTVDDYERARVAAGWPAMGTRDRARRADPGRDRRRPRSPSTSRRAATPARSSSSGWTRAQASAVAPLAQLRSRRPVDDAAALGRRSASSRRSPAS